MVGKNEIRAPHSKLKQAVLEQLKAAGYISDVKVEAAKPRDILYVTINNPGERSVITEISRVSSPGRRV
jgi:ribosomal protein S8